MHPRFPVILCSVLAAGCLNTSRAVHLDSPPVSGAAPTPLGPSSAPAVSGPGGAAASRRAVAPPPSRERVEGYQRNRHKSVVELQQFRELTRLPGDGSTGTPVASLIDLNPQIGAWYLLRLEAAGEPSGTYHLESSSGARLTLDPAYPLGIVIERGPDASAGGTFCELWPAGRAGPLVDARDSGLAYAPLCGGRVYLRNPVEGHRTPKERVVDLLRDHVWQGEELTVLVRDLFFSDAYLATSSLASAPVAPPVVPPSGPAPPLVSRAALDRLLVPVDLGIGLDGGSAGRVGVGRWYPVQDSPGIFVTTLRPDLVSPEVIEEQRGRVSVLDEVESVALVYLVAFDLEQFDLGFRLGTDHPRVGWSDMVLPAVRDDALTGPDGIETIAPLVRTGMLSPIEQDRVAATFTGGFKRAHGAFRTSDLARSGHGSHYGFVENGVVLSKLQPGLATALVFDDGRVELETWSEAHEAELPRIRHARQNGVPILERDADSRSVPGSRVRDWGPGNWSGSADRKLRTLRAGLCLQESQGRPFLVYGYFSSATPSSMARVFQASGCSYAMLLDMNALEHTYMAVYSMQGARRVTRHLIDGMGAVDGSRNGEPLPRFVSVADNRDFFYLLRRSPQ